MAKCNEQTLIGSWGRTNNQVWVLFLETIEINDAIRAGIHFQINADFLRCDYDVVLVKKKCTCPWEMQTEELRSRLQSQCNSYQNSNSILHKNRNNNPKSHMELQKTSNSWSKPEQEQSWRYHISLFQNILLSYSNQHYGTGIKTNIQASGTKWRAQK